VDDAKGIIIGLKWKRIANRDAEKLVLNSCFVITPANVDHVQGTNVQVQNLELVA